MPATTARRPPIPDSDGEGDACDFDDGLIRVYFDGRSQVEWIEEQGYAGWNCYRGDLSVLKSTGIYTQVPGSNPLAARSCDLSDSWWPDTENPAAGSSAFYLVTGVSAGGESTLGEDSSGQPRFNDNPCP
jgi:hypothetical protein